MDKNIDEIGKITEISVKNKESTENQNSIENTEESNRIRDEENEITVHKLIGSIFDDNSKKSKIIKRLRPYFSLKVVPQREIDKVYSAVEKIDPEKIDLVEEFKYEEEKFDSKNIFETKSKSLGLSNNDLNLSINIFGHKQDGNYDSKNEKKDLNSCNNSKIHCIHSIVISLFRIVIDYKNIKLAKQVQEDLEEVENSNATEKKILLEKFVDKFGLYIPLELIVGGRINISFEANNEEEKKLYHNNLQKGIKANLGGGISFISGNAKIDCNKKESKDQFSQSLEKIENASLKMIGGDYLNKDDLKQWVKSFNINNLQVIEYKTLIPIYCFIPGLEKKLKICLRPYEVIVLQEIYNLLDTKYKEEEKNIYDGVSTNSNLWKAGIILNNYESFNIYKQKIVKKLILDKFSLKKETVIKKSIICGEVPEGFIICGWTISTNANSKPYDIICSWERSKELGILWTIYFKFKVDITGEKDFNENNIEIEWTVEIFCICSNFSSKREKKYIGNENQENNCQNSNNNQNCMAKVKQTCPYPYKH